MSKKVAQVTKLQNRSPRPFCLHELCRLKRVRWWCLSLCSTVHDFPLAHILLLFLKCFTAKMGMSWEMCYSARRILSPINLRLAYSDAFARKTADQKALLLQRTQREFAALEYYQSNKLVSSILRARVSGEHENITHHFSVKKNSSPIQSLFWQSAYRQHHDFCCW